MKKLFISLIVIVPIISSENAMCQERQGLLFRVFNSDTSRNINLMDRFEYGFFLDTANFYSSSDTTLRYLSSSSLHTINIYEKLADLFNDNLEVLVDSISVRYSKIAECAPMYLFSYLRDVRVDFAFKLNDPDGIFSFLILINLIDIETCPVNIRPEYLNWQFAYLSKAIVFKSEPESLKLNEEMREAIRNRVKRLVGLVYAEDLEALKSDSSDFPDNQACAAGAFPDSGRLVCMAMPTIG